MKTTCVVAAGVNQVEVGPYDIREPLPSELLVETHFSAVSPGTELRCLAGKEPNAGPFPMITGYSLVGKVLRGAGDIQPNDWVFVPGSAVVPRGISRAWGGHIGHAIVSGASALKLSAGVDLLSASTLAMLSIALHGVSKSRSLVGDRVLVVGLGLIGQVAAALFRLAGCQVAVCDPMANRRMIAATTATYAYAPDPCWHERVRRNFPQGFDVLVDVTGVPAVVSANLPLLRAKSWDHPYEPSPKLVLLASYPGSVSLDCQDTLFNKETEIITCRNYLPHDLLRAARLLETGALDVRPFLAHVMPAGDADEGFRQLRERPDEHLTVVLDWQ